jgi:RimJ/RimL family protein N-acetyltransferase
MKRQRTSWSHWDMHRQSSTLIERLAPSHAGDYRTLMLEAYASHPDAFTSTSTEREKLPLTWWEARLSASPAAKHVVLGASHDGGLVGVVGLSFEQREKVRHKATLFGMYVRPRLRGRGIGRQLVQSALEYARDRPGVKVVQLTVTEGNAPAEALYESCGFVPFGVEPLAVAVGSQYLSKVHMWRSVDAEEREEDDDRHR